MHIMLECITSNSVGKPRFPLPPLPLWILYLFFVVLFSKKNKEQRTNWLKIIL